jgi:hypothetical protein
MRNQAMSCDIAAAAFLFLASTAPADAAPRMAAATISVAREPMYADIIARAERLKHAADGYRTVPGLAAAPAAAPLEGFAAFEAGIGELSALDMQGHLDLAKRGVDGDLKCILKGISQDLPLKLADLKAASTGAAQDQALRDMAYLLNDNVEVITAPPKPPV